MYQAADTRQCLICNESLANDTNLLRYLFHPQICQHCIQQFEILETYVTVDTYSVLILYQYNEFFKRILYQFKALDDYALKDAFLCCFPELKSKYKRYLVAIIPSSEQDNARRGFCPNEEIARCFSDHIFKGLYKMNEYKQTLQKDRSLIRKILKIKNGTELYNKKVLIFDDVMTSSNTVQAAILLIERYHPKSIDVLVLSSPHLHRFLNK